MKISDELKWIVPIVLVCVIVFANSLFGEFVYDDVRQILRNPLIQDNALIWKALTSDVWAFKGDGTLAASNYWRPTFTAWHILNFRLFGDSVVGWHVTNILLHSLVSVLGYFLMRRLGITQMLACAAALIFAIHPVHVESVAWISGSPDILFAAAFIGSLLFALNYAERKRSLDLILSLILYAVALGAKEIGILCLPIYYLVISGTGEGEKKPNNASVISIAYLAIAGIYFLMRASILGAVSRQAEDAASFTSAILSLPEMFAFYLRQIFFPYWLAASYPLQAVDQIGVMNFVLPLIISIVVLAGIAYLAKDSRTKLIAALLFLLPLLPAMNATAFIQIVHDRYLYLPLLGILILVVLFASNFISEKLILIGAAVLCLPLAFQTYNYNTAWASDLALWSWTTKIDNSAFAQLQYGDALMEKDRRTEAITALTGSINAKPTTRGYLARGMAYARTKQYAEAEKDLSQVLNVPAEKAEAYAWYQAYNALALVYTEQRKFDEASAKLDEGRKKLPIYSASMTAALAVVLYQKGDKEGAYRELQGAQPQARKELLPEAKTVFLRLGMLNAELGRSQEAGAALQEFIKLTESFKADKTTNADRTTALKVLQSLDAPKK